MRPASHKVSIRIRQSLLDDMKDMWMEKYGGKGKSRWVDEAINKYLTNENFFYQKANFLDATDVYAYQFLLEIKTDGALTKPDEDVGVKVSEKVKSKKVIEDPVSNEKFTLTHSTYQLLSNAVRNAELMKSHIPVNDPRSCIIRAAIEYAIVHDNPLQKPIIL